MTLARQRFYLNGKLHKSGQPRDISILRHYLDNIQKDWTRNMCIPEQSNIGCVVCNVAGFDPNNAHSVTRISPDELVIVNTGNQTLRFINVEVR